MTASSPLQPVDPSTVPDAEKEEHAPWIVRKLVGSMTGRIVMASYESLRAAGTTVICISPWGDSSPVFLPCIRFRDLVVHTVIVVTGGAAAVAAPVMGPLATEVIASMGSSIVVEAGIAAGFDLTTKVANDLLFSKPLGALIPTHSARLETTSVKSLLITLKYKHTISDAALGFFRSPVHKDKDLFSDVKDYFAVEKGWMNPYLFASSRRPVIPRSIKADVVFCHGPFLSGDYDIGEELLKESASVVQLCADAPPKIPVPPEPGLFDKLMPGKRPPPGGTPGASETTTPQPYGDPPKSPGRVQEFLSHVPILKHKISRSSDVGGDVGTLPPADVAATATVLPPVPRRMVITVLGLKPHRKIWTSSARPGESVMQYILLNGCPAVVIPVKPGSPLIAWDALTLEHLQKTEGGVDGPKFAGIVEVVFDYVGLCVDWERVTLPQADGLATVEETTEKKEQAKKDAVKSALALVVAGAIRSGESKAVKKDVDLDRAGIAMFRIP